MQKIDKKKIGSHEMCNATANKVIPLLNELVDAVEALQKLVEDPQTSAKPEASPSASAPAKVPPTKRRGARKG